MNKVKLGNYISIESGYTFKSKFFNDKEGLPIIRIRDVTSGNISSYYSGEYDEKYLVQNNDVLISMDGTFSIRKWSSGKALLNQRVCRIKSRNNSLLIDDYLCYILPKYLKNIEDKTPFVTVKHLSVKDISEIVLYLPNIETQRKIILTLDKAQELIDKRKEQIEACDELVKSLFYHMFGDPVNNSNGHQKIALKEIGEWKSGGTPSRSNKEYYNGNIPWLSSGELNSVYTKDSLEHITEDAIKNSSAKLIAKESLLLGMYDTAALKSTINLMECACNQAIAYAKLNYRIINTLFVYYCIQFNKDFYKSQQRGVRQKNLNLSMVKDIEVLFPSLELQNRFAEQVGKIEQQKQRLQQSLTELENNFNALIQRAFKGELF
ncbi:type I restriction enzyme S subunit [Paenibacillus endophyticus]|uniref:Type I restriction enzyme S subunit n=2 Tax=Paenibacillus endophyticus TaxID=1294268 RepID=A0A7W5GDH2_9BACL|nr:restriction endonuclease subunit S [Paenibacillus endophyticus]MBB3155453.1 type I restriction enzyme S subunit [Paenibacillus endophyticus]